MSDLRIAEEAEAKTLWLPEPEGYRTAQIHWTFLHEPTAVDGDPADIFAQVESAQKHNSGLKLIDPTFGQPLYFTAEAIRQVGWVGVVWIPHDQIQASAQRAKEQEQKQREAEAKAGFVGRRNRHNGR